VVLMHGSAEVASWPLALDAPPDLAVINELARLQLAARRLGCSIRLRDACPELWDLLELAGLVGVVSNAGAVTKAAVVSCMDAGVDAGGLVVEMGREPETGEELGIEVEE
jgi:hypothetical protein